MPKFTYSASKGIEQSSGSGFFVNGAPVVEHQQAITTAAAASADNAINAYGATSITLTNAVTNATATLADGSYIGQKKYIYVKTAGGSSAQLTVTPATLTGGTTILFDAAGEAVSLVWLGATAGWCSFLTVGATIS